MWPDDRDLPVEVEAAFGADVTADPGVWSWTDLSSRLRNNPIALRAAAAGSPGTCSVTLDNDDGALTPLHPMSPYWPNVELGTPLRVRLRRAEDAFARTTSNGWGTADSGQVWSQAGGSPSNFSVSGGAGRHAHSTVNVLRRTILDATLLDCEQEIDVAPSAMLTGAALVTGALARMSGDQQTYYWLRAEFNSGGSTLQLKISKTVNGVETQLASLNPVPSLAYAANTAMRVVASVVGSRLAIKVWNPVGSVTVGWHLSVTDTSITTAGRPGLQSWLVGGNTNTLPVSAIFYAYSLRVDRFNGFADQWEPTYLPTTTPGQASSAVRVTASGTLRRLGQGSAPLRSALYRAISATSPVAYWSLEDGSDSTQAASGILGGPPLALTRGQVGFAGTPGPPGSADLADFSSGGTMVGVVPASGTTTTWRVEFVTFFRTFTPGTFGAALQWKTGGTVDLWEIDAQPAADGGLSIQWITTSGAFDALYSNVRVDDQQWHHIRVDATQSGSNIIVTVKLDGTTVISGSVTTATMGAVSQVIINPTGDVLEEIPTLGHLAVWAPYAGATDTVAAFRGYVGETAPARILRLCGEEGVPVIVSGTDGEPQGPQPMSAFLDLFKDVEATDVGVLGERGWGVGYLARPDRYNTPVEMTVDLAAYKVADKGGDVLSPTRDDQGVVNEWTVSRVNGSSATVADAAHQRRGRYEDSVEVNVVTDRRLVDHASFRVHLGTVVDLREQSFPLDLAANPELIDGWLSCGVGSRIVRTNPPAQYPPGDLDRLVEGWSESIGPRSWMVQVTPSPASPWDVATVSGPQRVGAVGATLNVGITATATTLSIASPANALWTTKALAFPLDVLIGGERVTLPNPITGAASPQSAAGVVRAVNGVARAWPAGTSIQVCAPAVVAL